MQKYDLVIIGAGPAGLSCAISAIKKKLKILLIDKGNVVNSIINFPVNMTFFSTADLLELHDIPFNSMNFRPNRTEAVRYYHGLAKHFNISTESQALVSSIEKINTDFQVTFSKYGQKKAIVAKKVILATGFYDNPNLLNVEGENLGHVSHYYQDALKNFDQNVVIVGGKNSAVEAALDLHRSGARVSIVHRKSDLKESIKYWILPDIKNRISEKSIMAYLDSEVRRITPESVEIMIGKDIKKLSADAVYLLTGYRPDISLLEKIGVQIDSKSLEPNIDPDSFESTIPGLYLAGALIAGRNANKIFIENSREHGDIILSDLITKL
jgi:thioredoxin reductase (NADPH)